MAEKAEKIGKEIGAVTHFFDKIGVAVIKLKAGLKAGEKIRIKGATTDFEQHAESMQVDMKPIAAGKKGQEIGMKVKDRVRPGDAVYIV